MLLGAAAVLAGNVVEDGLANFGIFEGFEGRADLQATLRGKQFPSCLSGFHP